MDGIEFDPVRPEFIRRKWYAVTWAVPSLMVGAVTLLVCGANPVGARLLASTLLGTSPALASHCRGITPTVEPVPDLFAGLCGECRFRSVPQGDPEFSALPCQTCDEGSSFEAVES